jgi:hypothetical protein
MDSFTSREPSPAVQEDGKLDIANAELLYHEQGELELSSTVKFNFARKYIWRLKEDGEKGSISVWFTKPGTEVIDYLFHKIEIDLSKTRRSDRGTLDELEGTGGHLCVEDFYNSSYTFYLSQQDAAMDQSLFSSFQTVHEVRGPKKDQVITTQFTKQSGG